METKRIVHTKVTKAAEAITTNLTINYDGVDEEALRAGYEAWLVIRLQGQWRTNGVPVEATVNAKEHKPGTRTVAKKQSVEEMLAALSPEARAELIAKYSN